MELLALVAISVMSVIGWVLATEFLDKWIDRNSRFYFAPALGMAACAIIAYVAADTRQTWLIPLFTWLWRFVSAFGRACPGGTLNIRSPRRLLSQEHQPRQGRRKSRDTIPSSLPGTRRIFPSHPVAGTTG
jgi:hypothetical protein